MGCNCGMLSDGGEAGGAAENTQSMLRVSGIVDESIVDGEGLRFVLFVQGCTHACPQCHNPATHDAQGGEPMNIADIFTRATQNPLLDGVTFSGGEPFQQAAPLAKLGAMLRGAGLHITTYTGYTHGQLLAMAENNADIAALLAVTNVLIDGPYIHELRDLSLPFRGSSNQRIIVLDEGGAADSRQ